MASIVANIREINHRDNLAIMAKQKKIADSMETRIDDLPSYEDLFPNPLSSSPNVNMTPSLHGNVSEASTNSIPESNKSDQLTSGSKYVPSNWYYEPGNNPIVYELGQKVTNPFTDPLRALQTDGDRKKLKQVVTRNDFYRKLIY